jgi:hypothetical protein
MASSLPADHGVLAKLCERHSRTLSLRTTTWCSRTTSPASGALAARFPRAVAGGIPVPLEYVRKIVKWLRETNHADAPLLA